MFYEPDKKDHGLPYTPFKSCIVPRPIGWISTLSRAGRVNLAPFSQSNIISFNPGFVMFSAGGQHPDGHRKDSVVNAEETGEFVYNMATYELREAVSLTARIIDSSVDEMAAAGLTPAPSRLVKPPRVLESPINIECKYYTTVMLPGHDWTTNHYMVIGRVLGIHIKDDCFTADGKIDILKIRPLARLGYLDYTSVESSFPIEARETAPEYRIRNLSGG
jgi:flavin reductase (DIM6/NTAB) family NADH-FMN oxidoreductase RutF